MESILGRARSLIKKTGVDFLAKRTEIKASRWSSVAYKNVRMSTEELEALKDIYPQYAYWLITGEVLPESGQTSPDYDEVNSNLDSRAEG